MVYLVSFALKPMQNIDLLQGVTPTSVDVVVTHIKSVGPWARVNPQLWLVHTNTMRAAQVRDHIWNAMQQGDVLFVVRLQREWGAYNFDPDVVRWLEQVKF